MATDVQRPLSYYTWPAVILFALGSVIVAGIYTISIATSSTSELVHQAPYERGLTYQDIIDSVQAGKESGLLQGFELSRQQHEIVVTIQLHEPLAEGSTPKLLAIRPANSQLDSDVSLQSDAKNTLTGSIPHAAPGLWQLELSFTHNGKKLLFKKSVIVD